MEYIIIQAGGKGSRMGRLTENKPKALVPINNLPMIFHLFRKFPEKNYIIIGDYKFDVLERYLQEFAEVKYQLVDAAGQAGTCAGLTRALSYIPDNERFMLIWCDLVLPNDYQVPTSEKNIIGISKGFPCRWSYQDNLFIEKESREYGVAGLFIFRNKSCLKEVPGSGEFVAWLQKKSFEFEEQGLYSAQEYGIYEKWNELPKLRCRPFNRIEIKDNKLIKYAIDKQGRGLAEKESLWYRKIQSVHFANVPEIYQYEPLCMEYVKGKNIYEYSDISVQKKRDILKSIIDCLKNIHEIETVPADKRSYRKAYLDKTYDRLKKVWNLVPFAKDKEIIVNGRKCRNVLFHREVLEQYIMQYCPESFCLIHGDCTFSNIMLTKEAIPILIDPRGYFGSTELYGDRAYDWAKLYYSLYSNYDQFNLQRFRLKIYENSVILNIESNQWECVEDQFFELLKGEVT